MSIYTDMGYEDRSDYLACLAADTGFDESVVCLTADLLGPSEDFDGLVTILEDECERMDF